MPTFSKAALAAKCGHPFTAGVEVPDAEGDFAVGNASHAIAQRLADGHKPDDLSAVFGPAFWSVFDITPAERRKVETIAMHLAELINREKATSPSLYAAEWPVALDLESGTARALNSTGHRDYSDRRPTEISGTLDLVAQHDNGLTVVRDWKTSRRYSLGPPAESWQLGLAAVAVARLRRVDDVVVEYAYLDEEAVHIDRAELGAWELDAWADRAYELAASLAKGPSAPTPGSHCVDLYCPLLGRCTATRGALAAFAPEAPLPTITTVEQAARAVELLPRAEAALEHVKAELRAFASRQAVPLGDGRVYCVVEEERRSLSAETPEQRAALEGVLGEHVSKAIEVEHTISVASVRRAAAAASKRRGDIGVITDLALAALAQHGGVKTTKFSKAKIQEPRQ
jgi:hypothetical protein